MEQMTERAQELYIFNSMSGRKEPFKPLAAGKIGIYVCGITVYDYCHIGHARVMVMFDVVTRYLRYLGYNVHYVRNITDVDDKIFKRAHENNEPYEQLTARFINAMHEDERALGVLAPDEEPRATAYMADIIAMIEKLVDKGYAYLADNRDVYFSVARFDGYGKLSKQSLDDLQAGVRVDVEEAKRQAQDFALWKAAKPDEASWQSPWGPGRPGWHIECSAMSTACLGDSFDIHGGGPDLKFPHHENEIAQSEAATGKHYVNTWMHAGAVRVDDEKMSKSLGNFFTIREVLACYHPEIIRYFLLSSHYRSAINYSDDSLKQAYQALERFYIALRNIPEADPASLTGDEQAVLEAYRRRFDAAMCDDFNTVEALAVLFDITKNANLNKELSGYLVGLLKQLGAVLGILQQQPAAFLQGAIRTALDADEVDRLVAERSRARKEKNWTEADRIRNLLTQHQIVLDDDGETTKWRRSNTG